MPPQTYRKLFYFGVTSLLMSVSGIVLGIRAPNVMAQTVYHQDRGIEVRRRNRCGDAEYLILYEVGLRQYQQGRFREALDTFQTYRNLAGVSCDGSQEQEIIALNRLGLVYESLGRYENALAAFQESLIISEVRPEEDESQLLQGIIRNNLGQVFMQLGQYSNALMEFEAALKIHKQENAEAEQGTSHTGLGLAYFKLGQYDQSLYAYEQARALFRRLDRPIADGRDLNTISNDQVKVAEGIAWNGIGNAEAKLGRLDSALNAFDTALAIHQRLDVKAWEGITLSDRGKALIAAGRMAEAEIELWKAIDILDLLRNDLEDTHQISIFDTQAAAYKWLQVALIEQGKIEQSLEVSERSRARALIFQLVRRQANAELTQGEQDLGDALSTELLSVTDIQRIAKQQNAVLVEYSLIPTDSDSLLYIWIIQPTGAITFREISLTKQNVELPALVRTSLKSVGVRIRGGFELVDERLIPDATEQLQRLHQLLIEPITDVLPIGPIDRIIFVPQNELFLVPFAALQDASDQYLIEQHTVLTVPSIQIFDSIQQSRRSQNQLGREQSEVLLAGNPVMPSIWQSPDEPEKPLFPLTGAEVEANGIAQLLNAQALIGEAATESAIRQALPFAEIIHLATHGLLEYGNPTDSGARDNPGALALTPDSEHDGLLTSAEISDFKLNAELVVLSACDTGRGNITGDGVIGLSRSLLLAGAPSVIVSLWSVPDAPTADLMIEFYRQWQEEGLDKAQALRQAMLITMEQHPEPKDWAAFTLIGEAE